LTRLFAQTKAYQAYGELVTEMDTYIDSFRKRVPDMAYFTYQQIIETTKGIKVVPAFVIELLSDSKSYSDVEDKIQDYFDAGIKTVWYILPKTQKIHVYTSAKSMKVYEGEDICVAEPVLADFKFVVSDLFKPLL
jgi:Uma2 family endonuclease